MVLVAITWTFSEMFIVKYFLWSTVPLYLNSTKIKYQIIILEMNMGRATKYILFKNYSDPRITPNEMEESRCISYSVVVI